MPNVFSRPHPFYENTKLILIRSFIIGAVVAFILIVFQPFGTESFEHPYKNTYLAGHGLIAFLAFSFALIGLPKLFPHQLNEENWVVWKQILVFSIGFLLSFIGSYFYINWFFCLNFSIASFLSFFAVVAGIGLFPCIIIVLLDNNRRLKNNQKIAANLTDKIAQIPIQKEMLTFKDENDKETLSINANQLLFIQAASNYVEIHYFEKEKLKKQLLRNSLSKIENQLTAKQLKRCHRSYLVNLNLAKKITGNAQGYKLHFQKIDTITVPVSRTKGKELLAFFSEK